MSGYPIYRLAKPLASSPSVLSCFVFVFLDNCVHLITVFILLSGSERNKDVKHAFLRFGTCGHVL